MRYHQDSCSKQEILGVGHFNYESLPPPIAMVTKIGKFSHKINYKSGQI